MSPRRAAWLIAAGRVALGSVILLAPEKITAHWLGEENAALPVVGALARGMAVRDIGLGIAALQTLDNPPAAARMHLACAAADGVDALATLLARDSLPLAGVLGTVLVAGGACAAGVYLARELALGAPGSAV